jgi:hypothetical protein
MESEEVGMPPKRTNAHTNLVLRIIANLGNWNFCLGFSVDIFARQKPWSKPYIFLKSCKNYCQKLQKLITKLKARQPPIPLIHRLLGAERKCCERLQTEIFNPNFQPKNGDKDKTINYVIV